MAAIYLDQFLHGNTLVPQIQPFSSQVKCLRPEEMPQFMVMAEQCARISTSDPPGPDYRRGRSRGRPLLPLRLPQGRQLPAPRCRPGTGGPSPPLFRAAASVRGPHGSAAVIFESGKCIRAATASHSGARGRTVGPDLRRAGVRRRLTVPLNDSLSVALERAGRECIDVCPTAALSLKQESDLVEDFARRSSGFAGFSRMHPLKPELLPVNFQSGRTKSMVHRRAQRAACRLDRARHPLPVSLPRPHTHTGIPGGHCPRRF